MVRINAENEGGTEVTIVRVAERDRQGFEVAWYCNDCGEASNILWCGGCKRCQLAEKRHVQLIKALLPAPPGKDG